MSKNRSSKPSSKQDPHQARESERYDRPIASREFILSTLEAEKAPLKFDELAEVLGFDPFGEPDADHMEALRRRVGAMQRDGQLIQNRRGGLVPVDDTALRAGRISAHPDGFGFLIADEGGDDVFLSAKQMRQVMHGDRAVVCITGTDRRGRNEGRIVDIVERVNLTIVGRLNNEKGASFIAPDNKRLTHDVLVPPDELAGAAPGDMVMAEIIEQPSRRHPPVGKIIEVLGQHLDAGLEIDVALRSHGIPSEWPDDVADTASKLSAEVLEDDKMGRKDVRRLPLVTIDGADARDFDDAVYCERTKQGYRLVVAIADVAHYVKPGEPLDTEAVSRGTSVYFPGRVVPMLPEVLSNGLCSLNPLVDRLCMLCEMTLDDTGKVKRSRFYDGLMNSHARLTYSQVHEMLTDPDSEERNQSKGVVKSIDTLHELYEVLAEARKQRGAMEFDSVETRIVFDSEQKISEIVPVVRNDAHRLIEECMILANIAAATFIERHEMPALYRVHNGPKEDRLEDLRAFLALRGLSLGGGDKPTPLDYSVLAAKLQDRPDRSVVQTMMLRSMQQAIYQPKNEGHFGLALSHYAHFTSPIRRYPDLLVHRAIRSVLDRVSSDNHLHSLSAMAAFGESCSMMERRADEATRDVVSWLKCEYMQEHIGSEFPGVIASVTSFGLFVELDGLHVEGLIHITSLSRDYYRYESAMGALVGERTGRKYQLGDQLRVQVAAVNLEDRKIDFREVEQSHQPASQKPGAAGSSANRKKATDASSAGSNEDKEAARKAKKTRKGRAILKVATTRSEASDAESDQSRAKRAYVRPGSAKKRSRKKTVAKNTASAQTSNVQPAKKRDTDPAKQPSSKKSKSAQPRSSTTRRDGDGARTEPARGISASKKPTAKKTVGKKVYSKKTGSGKTLARKTAGKSETRSTGKPADRKQGNSKQGSSAKAVAKKSAASVWAGARKKSSTQSASNQQADAGADNSGTTRTVANKKPGSKKSSGKKITSKKTFSKKSSSKKTTDKKTAAKKTRSKKSVGKHAGRKKTFVKRKYQKQAASEQAASQAVVEKPKDKKRKSKKKTSAKKRTRTQDQ